MFRDLEWGYNWRRVELYAWFRGNLKKGGIGCYWRDRKCISGNLNAKREIFDYL